MPLVADVEPLASTLARLRPAEPLSHGALTVVPLLGPPGEEPDWLTLAEAGAGARLTEVSEAGAVPELRVEKGRADRCSCWTARSWWGPSRTGS